MNFFKKKFYQIYLFLLEVFTSNDAKISELQYHIRTGNKIDLKTPKNFADKIQWLKLFYYDETFGKYADKYLCREEVKERVGESILVNLIGVYESVDEIDFEKLPNKFALKYSHGSGFNLIVNDKTKVNWEKEKKRFKKYKDQNYYYKFREKIYNKLKPTIIIEELLELPDKSDLIDYKFQCFHGVPVMVLMKVKEDNQGVRVLYDMDWNKIQPDPCAKGYLRGELSKPANFEEMKQIAAKLSQGFPFIRVDLYSIGDKVYFGELTFIPNGGAKDVLIMRFNTFYGDMVKLPEN